MTFFFFPKKGSGPIENLLHGCIVKISTAFWDSDIIFVNDFGGYGDELFILRD